MKKSVATLTALAAAALLAGCETTPQGSGVDPGASVTRFHLNQPVARGEIRVEPVDAAMASSLEFSQVAASVERELTRLGWNVARGNATSEQVAVVSFDQGTREAMRRRSGFSIGVGAGTGSWGRGGGGGVGVGGSIPIGGSRAGAVVMSRLAVRIQRRSDASVFWEGRAEMEARADSPLANPVAAADRLAYALFQDFPGESGQTIRVQ